jgi:serine protease
MASGAAAQRGITTRALISDLTGPAIDRGLRENDPPRPPRTAHTERIDRTRGKPYVSGSVIVKFRPGTSTIARSSALSTGGATAASSPTYADFEIVTIPSSADPERAARDLSTRPEVEYAQARYRVHTMFVPNDPLYSRQWNFAAIDMERAWDIAPGATSAVTVAVIDSGIAFRSGLFRFTSAFAWQFAGSSDVFPALGTLSIPFAAAPELGGADRFVAPHDFIWNDDNPIDMDGHGTHVAGTIGQLTNNGVGVAGMAFNVRLMPVKVVDGLWDFVFDSPESATDDIVARGIRYAVDNGANVLNLSIGRDGAPAPVVRDALEYAVSHGAFVAIAAGNGFEDGNPVERFAELAQQIEGVVAVGAVGRDRTRAFYSTSASYVELAAPGGDERRDGTTGGVVQQTYDADFVDTVSGGPARYRAPRFDVFTYDFFQGTSMATPHAAGFAALLIQQGIRSPATIEAIMKQYATDLGTPGRDNDYGEGLINPRAALRGMGLVR